MSYGQILYAGGGTYAAGAEAGAAGAGTRVYPLRVLPKSRVLSVAPVAGSLVGTSHIDVVIPELES